MKKINKHRIILKPGKEHNNEDKYIKSSKIGGVPYWNKEKDIGLIKDEQYMLVAQINLEDIDSVLLNNVSEYYPQKGILQFFIRNGREDYEERFKIIYHENIGLPNIIDEAYKKSCLNILDEDHDLPIEKNILFSFKKGKADEIYISENENEEEDVVEKNDNIIEELIVSKIGGIPYLGQYGLEVENNEENTVTLLYLAATDDEDKDLSIMWGDCGEGVFEIDIEDLKNKDFEKASLCWTCG